MLPFDPDAGAIVAGIGQCHPHQVEQILEVLPTGLGRDIKYPEIKWLRYLAPAIEPGAAGSLGKGKAVGTIACYSGQGIAIEGDVGGMAIEPAAAFEVPQRRRARVRLITRADDAIELQMPALIVELELRALDAEAVDQGWAAATARGVRRTCLPVGIPRRIPHEMQRSVFECQPLYLQSPPEHRPALELHGQGACRGGVSGRGPGRVADRDTVRRQPRHQRQQVCLDCSVDLERATESRLEEVQERIPQMLRIDQRQQDQRQCGSSSSSASAPAAHRNASRDINPSAW